MNADEYTKMFTLEDRYWWFVGRRYLALQLLRRYVLGDRPTILDLGCGTGAVLKELQDWANPIGLDMSELALGYCRERGLRKLVQANGEALPLRDNAVDAIVGLDIFEHIADDRAAFAEAYRVLKPGGILVLSVPAFRSLWGPHDVALMHHRRYRRPEIAARLRDVGFETERSGYSVFFLFPVVVLFRLVEKRRKGPAKAQLVPVPEWANRSLVGLQRTEANLINRVDLPWGSSVVAVARKPLKERR